MFLGFCLLIPLPAPTPLDRPSTQPDWEVLLHDSRWRDLLDQQNRPQLRDVQRREQEWEERQLLEKVHRFVQLWSQFAAEYNHKRSFNIRIAKEPSKAFKNLEGSQEWPKLNGDKDNARR